MKGSNRLYVLTLVLITLLTAIASIVVEIATDQLPEWVDRFRPWTWPALICLVLITAVLVFIQARLEKREEDNSSSQPIVVATPTIYHNLPHRQHGTFIGREKELAQVRHILRPYPRSQEHLVTIDGVGGIGKSALALEVAHRYISENDALSKEERFQAIVWVSAKPAVLTANGTAARPQVTRTLEDIYTAIAITLEHEDITRAPREQQAELVTKVLKDQRTLLVVDNLETVDDERVYSFLLDLPAPTKAIVTTHHRIDVAYPVRLVGMAWEEAENLVSLECIRKGVSLSQGEMRRLYDRTGGVPLALVLSVGQIALGNSFAEVLRQLGNPQGDIARYCFEATVKRIEGKSAHALLLALAVFATDASRDALGNVAGFGEDVLSRDEGLVDLEKLSLANRREDRFSLLPLTKAYALSLSADNRPFRLRQEQFYVDQCGSVTGTYSGTTDQWESFSRIDLERQNLIDLLEWCVRNQRWQALIDLQEWLRLYWEWRGYWSDQERWCHHSLKASAQLAAQPQLSRENTRKKGRCHLALCWVRINQDRFDDARTEAEKAIQSLKPIEDWDGLAVAYRHLGLTEKLNAESDQANGHIEFAAERFARAMEHNEAALRIWGRLGDRREVSSVLANIGHLLMAQAKYPEAHTFLEQALSIRREIKDMTRLSTTLRGLADLKVLEGRLEKGSEYYHQALEIARQVGDVQSVGESLLGLAKIKLNQRLYDSALEYATKALANFKSLNETAFLLKRIQETGEIIAGLRP